MVLEIVSKDNSEEYRGFLPDSFFNDELMLGIVCLDEEEEDPIGFTMLTITEESLLVEYIFVLEEYRRTGAGSLMLEGAVEMAEAAGVDTLEIYYNSLFGNEDIPEDFLFSNGFLISEEGELLEFISSDLLYSDYVKNLKYPKALDAYSCTSLSSLSDKQKSCLTELLDKHGGSDFLPFCKNDLSYLCEKDGEITGAVLCGYDEERDLITIMELAAFLDDPMCPAKLLIALGHYVSENLSKETGVMFLKTEENKGALTVKLLDDESKLKSAGVLLHGVKTIIEENKDGGF